MLYLINAYDGSASPVSRWALTGPGYWTVFTVQAAANTLKTRFGDPVSTNWVEWDLAYAAAVGSGFVPKSGQTSRTVS